MKIIRIMFIVIIICALMNCWAGLANQKIRVFDFKYETFEFLDGEISMELPDKPRREIAVLYYKVLVDYALSGEAGHYEVSCLSVRKYKGLVAEKSKNRLIVKNEKIVDSSHSVISRMLLWNGIQPIILFFDTSWDNDIFPMENKSEDRIRKDDEIFEHIIESFRYRKEDGTYAKPEIIRQPEEVKEIEHTGSEYHGNK